MYHPRHQKLLVDDYGAELSVRVSDTEIPYSFVLDSAGSAELSFVGNRKAMDAALKSAAVSNSKEMR